jgi:hypothetical protein
MAQQRRLVFVLIASIPVFLAAPVWSATTPVIESALVNISTNQITVTGNDFEPAGTAPTMSLATKSLILVSSANHKVVANLPSDVPAGSYRLSLTNSSSQAATFTVTIGTVGSGQTFATGAAFIVGPQPYTYIWGLNGPVYAAGSASGISSIIPIACTIDAMYASVTPSLGAPTLTFPIILQQNFQDTTLQCAVSSPTPTACPVSPAISVSAGDTLDYVTAMPANPTSVGPYFLSMSLHCR